MGLKAKGMVRGFGDKDWAIGVEKLKQMGLIEGQPDGSVMFSPAGFVFVMMIEADLAARANIEDFEEHA